MKLYCATGNAGKLREFRLAIARLGQGRFELESLPGLDRIPPAIEDGVTFEENAILKALHYAPHAPGLLFADDSGLEVDALAGEPGVRSARYAGEGATDEANNRLLLERLGPAEERSGRFVCVIALARGRELVGTFRGAVEGTVLGAPLGSHGFGYDPLFYYPPFGCTFGQAGAEQKLRVSHRGRALEALLEFLLATD